MPIVSDSAIRLLVFVFLTSSLLIACTTQAAPTPTRAVAPTLSPVPEIASATAPETPATYAVVDATPSDTPEPIEPESTPLFPLESQTAPVSPIDPIDNQYVELESHLQWFDEQLTPNEERSLTSLKALYDQHESLALSIAWIEWIADGIVFDERLIIENLASLAAADPSFGEKLASTSWILDGVDRREKELLGSIGDISRADHSLAGQIFGYEWLNDGTTRPEVESIGFVASLVRTDPSMAKGLKRLAWMEDGISKLENDVLDFWNSDSSRDPSFVAELINMPMFKDSVQPHDLLASRRLRDLQIDYLREFSRLRERAWFKDGIGDSEAPLIPALHVQAKRGEYFDALIASHTVDSITFETPKGTEVTIFSYTYKSRSGLSFLRGMEQAIIAMEELMTVPFPNEELVYVFALPSEDEFIGWNLGTHMLLRAHLEETIPGDAVLFLMGFYYWKSVSSGSNPRGIPFWFKRGGVSLLRSFAQDRLGLLHKSLKDHQSEMEGITFRCESRGIRNIQDLINHLEANGYTAHRDSNKSFCNVVMGEVLFLNLLEIMGSESFGAAWAEIYRINESVKRPIAEDRIYDIFIKHSPANKVDQVAAIYGKWHGGQ